MNDLSHVCGTSMRYTTTSPAGPCLLRHGHDGPVHLDGNGVSWTDPQPTAEPEPLPKWERDLLEASERGNATDWKALAREMEIRLKNETAARIEAEDEQRQWQDLAKRALSDVVAQTERADTAEVTLAAVRDWFHAPHPTLTADELNQLSAILNPKETT